MAASSSRNAVSLSSARRIKRWQASCDSRFTIKLATWAKCTSTRAISKNPSPMVSARALGLALVSGSSLVTRRPRFASQRSLCRWNARGQPKQNVLSLRRLETWITTVRRRWLSDTITRGETSKSRSCETLNPSLRRVRIRRESHTHPRGRRPRADLPHAIGARVNWSRRLQLGEWTLLWAVSEVLGTSPDQL